MRGLEEKVDRLEHALEKFVINVGNSHLQTEAELREFKDEMRQQIRDMNIKWGEMANKLGTIVEDLVAPSIPKLMEGKNTKGFKPREW